MVSRSTANVLGCGLALLLLSGCSVLPWSKSTPQRIEISAKPVERPPLVLPKADRLQSRPVEWIIITPENYEEVFAKIEKEGKPMVLFGLTDKGYEHLALNLSDIRAFIQQQQAIIAAYEGYYQEAEKAIEEANKEIEETNRSILNSR